jgi:hypothetical protein
VVTDVPEPGTDTLMLTGLGIMGWLVKRKKHKQVAAGIVALSDTAPLRRGFHFFETPATVLFLEAVIPHSFSASAFSVPEAAPW